MTTDATPRCPARSKGGTCGKPTPDATICRDCTDRLARDLAAVPWLRAQLDLSLSRQTASGRQDGGRSADKPLPYDMGASDALDVLGKRLTRWASEIGWRAWKLNVAARVLGRHIDDVRQLADAAAAHGDITSAIGKARRAIDRQPDRVFAGPCDGHGYVSLGKGAPEQGCGDWLYATLPERGDRTPDVTCKACTTVYDVGMRRTWMLDAAEDYLVNAATLSRFVSRLGAPVKANTIRKWRERGRLEQRGVDEDRNPTYRIGDVLDLVHGEQARAAARVLKG